MDNRGAWLTSSVRMLRIRDHDLMETDSSTSGRTLESALREFSDPDRVRYMDELKQFARRPLVVFTGSDPYFEGHLDWGNDENPWTRNSWQGSVAASWSLQVLPTR